MAKSTLKITPSLRKKIIEIVDEHIRSVYISREDFSEVKAIIGELAKAQKRTEEELSTFRKLTEENFNRVWESIDKLAEAQRKTEEEVRKLTIAVRNLQVQVGGLSNSFGYAFENEAYRMLPKVLRERYGIEITEKFVRTELGGKEINILGWAREMVRKLL